jgi:hypothetical protein
MKKTLLAALCIRGGFWIVFCLGLPLVGVRLAGEDLGSFFTFPPIVGKIGGSGMVLPVAIVYWILQVFLFLWLLWPRRDLVALGTRTPQGGSKGFPAWGFAGILWLVLCWILAWGRFEWFGWGQKFTFTPLWIGYILVVNSLIQFLRGTCPMFARPKLFLLLFPVSAGFWWVFEYYNRFVQNWVYTDTGAGAWEYFLHASCAFSTVLPAVYSTAEALRGFGGLQDRMTGPELRFRRPRLVAWVVLSGSCLAFLFVGVHPRELYPLLWTGPILVWLCLSTLAGQAEDLGAIDRGDWRVIWNWALAALICGFFWEMWNFWSLVKWEYQVPYLHGALVFEMPLAGFLGYLPFGLECFVVTRLCGIFSAE